MIIQWYFLCICSSQYIFPHCAAFSASPSANIPAHAEATLILRLGNFMDPHPCEWILINSAHQDLGCWTLWYSKSPGPLSSVSLVVWTLDLDSLLQASHFNASSLSSWLALRKSRATSPQPSEDVMLDVDMAGMERGFYTVLHCVTVFCSSVLTPVV